MKIIDAFTFFNEIQILEARLRILYDSVDAFVIVEADKTHTGKEKESYYLKNREKFAWAAEKIVHYIVNIPDIDPFENFTPGRHSPSSGSWRIENLQRNGIDEACKRFDSDDVLIISDVDEIPSREAIDFTLDRIKPIGIQQLFFYYNLRFLRQEHWIGSVITSVGLSQSRSAQWHRDKRCEFSFLRKGGWHLSYFGGETSILNKLDSFAHQEYNISQYRDKINIAASIQSGKDLFNRKVSVVDFNRENLPDYFIKSIEHNMTYFFGEDNVA